MPSNTIHSILLKKENAHEDLIYGCAWGSVKEAGTAKDSWKDYIVTGGLDNLVKVWSFENNKLELLHTLEGHEMPVVSVAISPDGEVIASTSLDSSLIIWDLIDGHKVREIQTDSSDMWKVAFSPDGAQVATGGHTGKVTVYNIMLGTVDKVLDTRGKFVMCVAWSSDGRFIASGTEGGTVYLFDVNQGKMIHTIEAHTQPVRCLAFSPLTKLLASASNDGYVNVYNIESAALQNRLEHKSWAVSVCFSPDEKRMATSSADGTVRIVLLEEFKVLHTFEEHTNIVCGIQFNREGTKLVSVSKDKSINIYECPVPPKNTKKK